MFGKKFALESLQILLDNADSNKCYQDFSEFLQYRTAISPKNLKYL